MNENTAKGTFDKLAGKIKETVGQVTGDKELEAKGKLEQAKGSVKETVGEAQDAGKNLSERIKKAVD